MTVKEKAQEIVNKFVPLVDEGNSEYNLPKAKEIKKNAKKAAVICVDEIMKFGSNQLNWTLGEPYKSQSNKDYWEQVKKAITEI